MTSTKLQNSNSIICSFHQQSSIACESQLRYYFKSFTAVVSIGFQPFLSGLGKVGSCPFDFRIEMNFIGSVEFVGIMRALRIKILNKMMELLCESTFKNFFASEIFTLHGLERILHHIVGIGSRSLTKPTI